MGLAAEGPPRSPAALLYDLDGVLVRSAPAWLAVMNQAARHFGRPPVGEEAFRRTFGEGVDSDRRRFFPNATVEEIAAFYEEAFPAEIPSVEVMPGAPEVLDAFRRRGVPQAVVTNSPRDLARRILEEKRLVVDTLAAAGDAADKPAPDLLLLALRTLGVGRQEAIYVGDSVTDREAARAAGVFFVGLGLDGDARVATLGDLPLRF